MAGKGTRTNVETPPPKSVAPEQVSLLGVEPPSVASTLATLTGARVLDLCRLFGVDVHEAAGNKARLIRKLDEQMAGRLAALLRELGRDELGAVCKRHGINPSGRPRAELQGLLLSAAGLDPTDTGARPTQSSPDELPKKGQIVHARHRQWLVDEVAPGVGDESPLVRLICLDDDDPGRVLEVLWALELGARVVAPEMQGLGSPSKLDAPAQFGAYLHAIKWSAVSAANATLFQAPFRAGILLKTYQLTPLMKALELPRANLFIADDVGLGKTIEAGLVLQELLLRQQASFVLVVCPASVCLQWQGEMLRRFGLRFEVMTRQFVAYRREERGFGTNPWSTHNRFIVSHSILRRPEYADALLHHLGDRARKGLLILDEAHAAAPASASRYATDTDITRTIRTLAPRFDNRLFLSATPHNGHSNSFSALLEILDPVRFTRGVPVSGKKALAPIMVRRLKRDLGALGLETFPQRVLVQLALQNESRSWTVTRTDYDTKSRKTSESTTAALGPGEPLELTLATKLQRYTELCAPAAGQARFPFVCLQQRLLSSPEAFARTLEAHAQGLSKRGGPVAAAEHNQLKLEPRKVDVASVDPELHGMTDEAIAEEDDTEVRKSSLTLPTPTDEARQLLSDMRALAEKARHGPDAKTQALFAWMREHLCPALGLGDETKASRAWTSKRVLIFTEYADTKRYLVDLLRAAIEHTDRGDERILQFHGGMGDDTRDAVQKAFSERSPDEHPVRILVATDAAREGVNLQGHCADLFHIDIPWNPSRLEQRNGRIDRMLQPASEVHCHYFVYPERTEDQVLEAVVRKVEVVQRELGSLGAVLLGQLERTLENGITKKTQGAVDSLGEDARKELVEEELEAARDLKDLQKEIALAQKRFDESAKALQVNPESLRGVVEIGLGLAGAGPLEACGATKDEHPIFTLPKLDRSWDATLDVLRPPRERDESFWDWRLRSPRPVTFHPLKQLDSKEEQLHLAHPLVKRILDRFLAQGFGAHDLTRVTAVVAPGGGALRVIAYARLTLFGPGAARLHDELVPLVASWSGDDDPPTPELDRADSSGAIKLAEQLLAGGAKAPNAIQSSRIQSRADALFRSLWPHLEAVAQDLEVAAKRGLGERAHREGTQLRELLNQQLKEIDKAKTHLTSPELYGNAKLEKEQKRQLELDLKHLDKRREEAKKETISEPEAIRTLYEVRMTRLTPIGLVVLWPEMMT